MRLIDRYCMLIDSCREADDDVHNFREAFHDAEHEGDEVGANFAKLSCESAIRWRDRCYIRRREVMREMIEANKADKVAHEHTP